MVFSTHGGSDARPAPRFKELTPAQVRTATFALG